MRGTMSEQKLSDKLRLCQQAAGTIDWEWLIPQVASLEQRCVWLDENHSKAFDDFQVAEDEINEAIKCLKTAIYRLNQ